MRFQIRVEHWKCGDTWWEEDMEEAPLEGAYYEEKVTTQRKEIRYIPTNYTAVLDENSDPKLAFDLIPLSEPRWENKGTNHREEDGHYVRDIVTRRWFIEIESMEHLQELCRDDSVKLILYNVPPTLVLEK